ncbi:MAG: hypothetical protein ABIJ97_02515 [Bacteroidota bacterium]
MKDSKTVFIEYSTFRKGQHFMTVVHVEKGKRQIIGRIFKVYDKEKEKNIYYAKDSMGNDVFVDTKELYALKKQFKECGKSMAMSIPAGPNPKEHDDFPYSKKTGTKQSKEKSSREKDLKELRQRNSPTTEKEQETKNENKEPENEQSKPEKSDREKELEEVREKDNDQEKDQDMEQELDR